MTEEREDERYEAQIEALQAERETLKAERDKAQAMVGLARKVMYSPLSRIEPELIALEPGKTSGACLAIDIANLRSSVEAGARQIKALRAQLATLADENASLCEAGRQAEKERDEALAKFAEKTADLTRLWFTRKDLERERDEARSHLDQLQKLFKIHEESRERYRIELDSHIVSLTEARAERDEARAACERLGDMVTRMTGEQIEVRNIVECVRTNMYWLAGHLGFCGMNTEADLARRDADRLSHVQPDTPKDTQ
jgi:chromosome segregation ATPase